MTYPVSDDAQTKSDDIKPLTVPEKGQKEPQKSEESASDSLDKKLIKEEAVDEKAEQDNTDSVQVSLICIIVNLYSKTCNISKLFFFIKCIINLIEECHMQCNVHYFLFFSRSFYFYFLNFIFMHKQYLIVILGKIKIQKSDLSFCINIYHMFPYANQVYIFSFRNFPKIQNQV